MFASSLSSISKFRWIVALMGAGVLAFLQSTTTLNAQGKQVDDQALDMSVAIVLADSKPTMGVSAVFQLTNRSDRDITVDPAGVSRSPIVIVKPDGKEVTYSIQVTRIRPLPKLAPGKTISEKINIFDVFSLMSLNSPGTYKIYWKTSPHGSQSVFLSDKVSIIREKNTPIMDMATGMLTVQN